MSKASATYQSSIALIPQNFSESFSWCGLLINTQTLYVTSDYSKFFGFRINDSLTLDRTAQPLQFLSRQLKMY